jgi:hypothetical protein
VREFFDEAAKTNATVGFDRRRPGRREVSPELVMLLRKPASVGVPRQEVPLAEPEGTAGAVQISDPLKTARGIALGVVLSALVWTAIGGGGCLVLR